MKSRVNFLSSLQAGRLRKDRARQALIVAAALGVCLIGGQMALVGFRASGVKKEISALESDLQGLRDLLTMKAALEKKKADLDERLRQLEGGIELRSGSSQDRRPGSELLAGLAATLPPGVWFDRMVLQLQVEPESGQEPSVRIAGTSFSQEELLDFLSRLEQDPRWRSATLESADRESGPHPGLPGWYRYAMTLNLPSLKPDSEK